MNARTSQAPVATALPAASLLQRKCACGKGTSALSDDCEDCQRAQALGLQPQLAIGASDDPLEVEADRAAAQVLSTASDSGHLRSCSAPHLSRLSTGSASAQSAPDSVTQTLNSSGEPLSAETRAFFEPRFGHDFGRVRVHRDSTAAASALEVAAHAYTVGRHLVFAHGRYEPSSAGGRALLAHELAHVVQQRQAPEFQPKEALEVGASGDGFERDAHGAANRVLSGQPAGVAGVVQRQRLQRFSVTEEAAGGCGVCYGAVYGGLGPAEAGNAAHAIVQLAFLAHLPRGRVELPFSSPGDDNGRLDLAIVTQENGLPTRVQIGEIKPATPHGEQQGMDDLDFYETAVREFFSLQNPDVEVERLVTSIPVGRGLPMPDPIATLAGCVVQRLGVVMMRPGLYGYFCDPPFSEARRLCSCRPPEPRREPLDVPVPVPVSPPVRVPNAPPQGVGVPESPPVGGREPHSPPVTAPTPEGSPETSPETEPNPDNVIPFPGRPRPGTEESPEAAPEGEPEWIPAAARISLLGAALTATALMARTALRNAPRAAANRALGYVQAVAAVALIVLYSSRVEARVGPGESPLETLFEAMRNDGIEIPPELRERIENDPALRATLEQAAQTGDLSAAQQQITSQMMQVIADNPDDFSEEDLRILAAATEAASAGDAAVQPTVETLRAAIDARRRGESIDDIVGGSGTGTGGGAAAETDGGTETEPGTDAGQTAAEPLPGISDELNQRLSSNPEIRRLFDAMTGQGDGPAVTEEVVERFLAIVPADLNRDESIRLITNLQAVAAQTVDEILASLQGAVGTLRGEGSAPVAEVSPTAPPSTPAAPPTETTAPTTTPTSDEGARVAARLRGATASAQTLIRTADIVAGTRMSVFVARMYGRYLVGGFVSFTPIARQDTGVWTATIHPTRWYNQSGQYVETQPIADMATTITPVNN
jgi:hypothetical protein